MIAELLDALGDRPEVIRHSLWWGGYRGCQYRTDTCVVAEYLSAHGVERPQVMRGEVTAGMGKDYGRGHLVDVRENHQTSPAMHEFLHSFDHGRYPELLWRVDRDHPRRIR